MNNQNIVDSTHLETVLEMAISKKISHGITEDFVFGNVCFNIEDGKYVYDIEIPQWDDAKIVADLAFWMNI